MTSPLAELRYEDGSLVIVLAGDWALEHDTPRFEALVARNRSTPGTTRALTFDASSLGTWDSSLLIFLSQCQEYAEAQQLETDRSTLPEQLRRLLALSEAVPQRSTANDDTASQSSPIAERLGKAALGTWSRLQSSLTFTGEVALAIAQLPGGRVHMRWREFWVCLLYTSPSPRD